MVYVKKSFEKFILGVLKIKSISSGASKWERLDLSPGHLPISPEFSCKILDLGK